MNRLLAVGAATLGLGAVGYGVGLFVPYPGRAFSLTAVMVGLALVVVGRAVPAEVSP